MGFLNLNVKTVNKIEKIKKNEAKSVMIKPLLDVGIFYLST